MPQKQPRTLGVQRVPKKSFLHEEVERNLEAIAEAEDKSFSYVVAEIVYAFFGLKVTANAVKVARSRRKKKAGSRGRSSARRYVRRLVN